MNTDAQNDVPVRLVLADVDGTLVTQEKILTPRAVEAVSNLRYHGIAFTIVSGRPPRGMKMVIDQLKLTAPVAAFNGGLLVHPDLSVIRENPVPAGAVQPLIRILSSHSLDVWIYSGDDWFVRSRRAPHVDREEWTVKFAPTVVPDLDGFHDGIAKLVGVSDDHEAVARCETAVQKEYGGSLSATRSQPYYLDVTHPQANKGEVVSALSELLKIPTGNIATIGDGPNDVLMFNRGGISIAMGNASSEVRQAARFVTTSNQEEGFANAMERFVMKTKAA
jgi:Cof subfamily protein (haloacid dehalogenase superfamily)